MSCLVILGWLFLVHVSCSVGILARALQSDIHVPVVLLHGINNQPRDWDIFVDTIRNVRSETGGRGRLIQIHSPFDGVPGSWLALNDQVKWFEARLRILIQLSKKDFANGFDLVCHSQGAVICRALIQDNDDFSVRSFISLAGPQLGVYGDGFFPKKLFPSEMRDFTVQSVWKLAYEDWAQKSLSPANLWHDPYHEHEFLEKNLFLPAFLGLAGTKEEILRRKRNFIRLTKAAFLVGNFSTTTYDRGIDPWISGIFGYYDHNGNVMDMWHHPVFINDTFGLRTLYEKGGLVVQAVPNVLHDDWIFDPYVIRYYVIPHLTTAKQIGFPNLSID